MKKHFLGLLCLFIISASVYADMSKEELQQMYLAYLKSQNMSAKIDGDGDIEFTYNGSAECQSPKNGSIVCRITTLPVAL